MVKQSCSVGEAVSRQWMFMEDNSGENLRDLLYGSLDSFLLFYLAGTVLVWSTHFALGI